MSTYTFHTSPGVARVRDALQAHGCRPTMRAESITAHCPLSGHSHEDKTPSLSVYYDAKKAKAVVRCHRGEHYPLDRQILETIGLSIGDIFDEPLPTETTRRRTVAPKVTVAASTPSAPVEATAPAAAAAVPSKKRAARRSKVAEYDYLGLDGALVMRVLRYEPKGFSQQVPTESGRMKNAAPPADERILYRLPAVSTVALAGGVVHLCEGEKDADAVQHDLVTHGREATEVATCWPMGATKFQPQYLQQLAGASEVVVYADRDYLSGKTGHDDSGAAHARLLVDKLTAAEIACRVVEAAEGKDVTDHLAAGRTLADLTPVTFEQLLERLGESASDTITPDAAVDGSPPIPPSITSMPTPGEGHHEPTQIPMGRGKWGYITSGTNGDRSRGVYCGSSNDGMTYWTWVAPLPYVQARVIRRDGAGTRTGMDYLLAEAHEGKGVLVDRDGIRMATWSNQLGMPLSADDKVQKAVATAIQYHGDDAPIREATPRVESDGSIAIAVPDTLPPGYLRTSDATREDGLAAWAQIIELAARSPKMALVLGATAAAPFIAAAGRQSHILYLYGDMAQGKTVTLRTAGCIWGDATGTTGVLRSWNTTAQGITRICGALGVLPPFVDEIGQASLRGPAEWGKFISDLSQGGSRLSAYREHDFKLTRPWNGVFLASGNGLLTHGLGAGRHAGIHRRVVELGTPFALDREHAESFEPLCRAAFGHAGIELLSRHNTSTVQPLIDAAAADIGEPDDVAGAQIARHLHAYIAGAQLLDDLAGTGTTLRAAAIEAAVEYLQQWAPPEHDADRIVGAIRDAIGREPAMWPTCSQYDEIRRPREYGSGFADNDATALPQHGVDRSMSGLQHDDGEWIAVFTASWRSMCADLDVDATVALRELHKRGVLRLTGSSRRTNQWTVQVKASGARMYQLVLPTLDDEDNAEPGYTRPTATNPPEMGQVADRLRAGCGSVAGEVAGIKPPLTSMVADVADFLRKPSRIGAQAREEEFQPKATLPEFGEPTELARYHRAPCVVCGHTASHAIDGRPVHLAECVDRLEQAPTAPSAPDTPQKPLQQPADACEATPAPIPVPTPSAATRRRTARFTAPAAVLDAHGVNLPGGETLDWPAVRHIGDLAVLTSPEQLALGWGGGEDRLPDQGQIWLTAEALTKLGLPAQLPADDKPRAKALADLASHPFLLAAAEDGWQVGKPGVWTQVWHPERHRGGARIVALPWHRIDGVSLFADDPHPVELADRLLRFAQATGVAYRISPATTGLDVIDHYRPPRRDEDDTLGSGRGRVAVVKEGADLPDFLHRTNDLRFANLESDWSWWRTPQQMTSAEQNCTYVHAYDRNASYLAPWSNITLGVSGLTHHTGATASWDGTEKPGYFLVDEWTWDRWGLPDPGLAAGARIEGDRRWVTSHTLRQLQHHGITPTVHEAYTWATTSRYLEPAGKALTAGREHLAPGDPVLGTLKGMYAATVGKLGQREHNESYHLWRPDWRHHIIAASRTAILHTLTQIADGPGGMQPLVVDHDLIVYASNDPNPVTAWPGNPAKLATPRPGGWKPVGSAELQQWAPRHLQRKPGRWNQSAAVADLSTYTP